jgi:hypothetical protein
MIRKLLRKEENLSGRVSILNARWGSSVTHKKVGPIQVACHPMDKWSPTGKVRGTSVKYPPTPMGAEALRRANTKASEGYPPVAKSAEALILPHMNDPTKAYAFIHGQGP